MKNKTFAFILTLFFVIAGFDYSLAKITIDSNFENGYIGKYQVKEPDTIKIGPVYGHRESWFSFKISGVKGIKVNFTFEWLSKGEVYAPNYNGAINNKAMVTYDGKGYEIIKDVQFSPVSGNVTNDRFTGNYYQKFSHVFREDTAFVCYCAPWSNTTLANLAAELKTDPRVTVDSIGNSKFRNLPLTYFKITDKSIPDKIKKNILVVTREDSYEVGGTWASYGILRYILSNDEVAKTMLKKTVFYILPIFSIDGVAMGHTNYPLLDQND